MSLPPHVAAIRRQLELASKLQSSLLDPLSQMESTLVESIRRSHIAIYESLRTNDSLAHSHELVHQSNQHFLDSLARIQSNAGHIESLAQVHATWVRDLQGSVDLMARVEIAAKSALLSSLERTLVAEQIIARIDLKRIHREFARQADFSSRLLSSFGSLAPRFRDLTLSTGRLEAVTALPSFVMPSASRELVTAAHTLTTLSLDDAEVDEEEQIVLADSQEASSDAQELLCQVDPALARANKGAREALRSGSVDRARHVLASLRELWSHLLRTLAPDESVLPWATGRGSELTQDGKLTRRARLLYICREINHEPLSDFLHSDTKALLDYIQFLNRVHQLEPGLSDQQLNALLLRSDLWLTFTIRVAREGA